MQLLNVPLPHKQTAAYGAQRADNPTGVPQHHPAAVPCTRRNWASPKPSTGSNHCSHGHTTAAISQEDRNYNNLEQTTPKAICKQVLSAECFVERISPTTRRPQAVHGADLQRGRNKSNFEAAETCWQIIFQEKSKGKVSESSFCCVFFCLLTQLSVRGVIIPCNSRGSSAAATHASCQAACLHRAWSPRQKGGPAEHGREALIEYGCPPAC